jgi:hypothetical protein
LELCRENKKRWSELRDLAVVSFVLAANYYNENFRANFERDVLAPALKEFYGLDRFAPNPNVLKRVKQSKLYAMYTAEYFRKIELSLKLSLERTKRKRFQNLPKLPQEMVIFIMDLAGYPVPIMYVIASPSTDLRFLPLRTRIQNTIKGAEE